MRTEMTNGSAGAASRVPTRPKARWYLLVPLFLLMALPFYVTAMSISIWSEAKTTPSERVDLTRGVRYRIEGYGVRVNSRGACVFSPTGAGGPSFTVLVRSGSVSHHTKFVESSTKVASFAAPATGRFEISCNVGDGSFEAGVVRDRGPTVGLFGFTGLGLTVSSVASALFIFLRRRRFRRLAASSGVGDYAKV